MKVIQIADVLNYTIGKEVVGEVDLIQEDLSNLVDVGKLVQDYNFGTNGVNGFVSTLIDRVGRVKFVDRKYSIQAPDILKDSFEYGSILMKVRAEVPDFQENTSWKLGEFDGKGIHEANELDPFVISAPGAIQKVYNSRITYEAPITISEKMLKQAFTSAIEMGKFIATIENRIQLKMALSTNALIMRTINNLIGLKIGGGKNVVDLLAEYNSALDAGDQLTAAEALRSTDFLRFATKTISLYKDYLKTASVKYNDSDSYITFTPEDKLKFVALSEFAKDMETYLYSQTYHEEFVKMSGYSTVPYWQSQGEGEDDFAIRSGLAITCTDGTNTYDVVQSGIVAVMFDEEAAAVVNENYRITSQYNPRGEYTNYFYKWDAGYMNDTFENCVVFIVSDDADGSDSGLTASYDAITTTGMPASTNPSVLNWYERSGAGTTESPYVYTQTTDTTIDALTTYYERTVEKTTT